MVTTVTRRPDSSATTDTPKNRPLTCANAGRRTRGAHASKIANLAGQQRITRSGHVPPAKTAILAVTQTRTPSQPQDHPDGAEAVLVRRAP